MDEKKVTGQFRFDQDSKRFHRFKIETDVGVVGTLLQKATGDAVTVLTTLMNDTTVPPASRINAARAILSFAVQTTQIEECLRRIEALEEGLLK